MSDPLFAAIGNNPRLLGRVREALLRQTPVSLQRIDEALSAADSRALYQAAHKLKGSVSNFPGAAAIELASSLELAATDSDFASARALVPQLSAALEDLVRRIDAALAPG